MENKDIEKYQEIWEGLFFLHILLTKIYMEVIRGGFLYILYSYRNSQKYSHTYHTKYIFCFERKNPIWKVASKIGFKIKCHIKNGMKWAVSLFRLCIDLFFNITFMPIYNFCLNLLFLVLSFWKFYNMLLIWYKYCIIFYIIIPYYFIIFLQVSNYFIMIFKIRYNTTNDMMAISIILGVI